MALDRGRILSELNSVMSQLQGADCGCMDKLFSNSNQQSMQPMQTGCGNTGGCCRRGPCQMAGGMAGGMTGAMPDGMGGGMGGGMGSSMGRGMGGPCMSRCGHACNPVKMYTDTYNYLNANLMQPTVKEVMEDFQGMDSVNTGGGISNAGGTGNANMAGSGGGMQDMSGMGMPAGQMGIPNMSQGMGEQIMKMMDMSSGGKGQKVSNFGMGAQGGTAMSSGQPQQMDSQNYMQGDQQGYNNITMGQGHPMSAAHGGLTGGMQGDTAMTQSMGKMVESHGHPMMRGHTNQMQPSHGNMHAGYGNINPMESKHEGFPASTMMQPVTNVIYPNSPQKSDAMPAQQVTPQMQTHMNHVSPSQGNMPMGQGQVNQMSVPQGGTTVPSSMQGDPNGAPANVIQGTQGHTGTGVPGQGNMNTTPQNPMMRRGYCRNNMMPKGITFNQMFPGAVAGAEGGDLGFDPMAIAWQMNPANQKLAAIHMVNNLMNSNKGFSNYMHNFMGAPQPPATPAAQPTSAANADPPAQSPSQVPLSTDLNSVPPAQPGAQPVAAAEQDNGVAPPTTTQPQPPEPIYPAETKIQPPARSPQYEYNALGQPIQLIPSERYHAKLQSLPQTLSPQPPMSRSAGDPVRYSSVKSTVSKTSIPRRSTTRIPSRARLNLNRGTVSNTAPNAKQAMQGGSQSDGRLYTAPQVQRDNIPIEAVSNVAGDASSGQQNSLPVKVDENKGLPEGSPTNMEAGGTMLRGKHNGLQDRNFTPCPNSSWSFGSPRLPYPYSYGPPPTQRTIRRKF